MFRESGLSKSIKPASLLLVLLGLRCASPLSPGNAPPLALERGARIVLVGNNLCSRMMNFGHFETELHARYPDRELFIRNMCDGGNTPGFRPHSGRPSPWAFPGAEAFQTELARDSGSEGHFETPDEWLTRLGADVIVAFFGFGESLDASFNKSVGESAGVDNVKAELSAFVEHTLAQHYNGSSPPQLALVSPIAFEDLSDRFDLPDGKRENQNLAQYTEAMEEVAVEHGIRFVDAFRPTRRWYGSAEEPLTIDGLQLGDEGYERFATLLADGLFGKSRAVDAARRDDQANDGAAERTAERAADYTAIRTAVLDKNWFWHNDFKIPNGVHVFGRRFDPFGPDNYPFELAKIREMTAIRDSAIWAAARGERYDVAAADARTSALPPVETNFVNADGDTTSRYLYGDEALASLHTAPGYRVELFASEREFPDLANPVQLSFDARGRLWVAVMPSYPHYKPGDARPDDKLLILEDTDGDGRADRQTTFADGLHLPIGFELAAEGVYVSQGTNLVLLRDTDGDDRADAKEILLSGFDDHDTHHAISAFAADESGAIFMAEGTFLHTNVETPYGVVRGTNAGFYRYSPQRHKLERTAQLAIPNPWGIAFDAWGQPFFLETSGPAMRWMTPGTIKSLYGVATHKSFDLIEEAHAVRPTSGLEFVSSRHFPDAVQGDYLLGNTIGFLGIKQHTLVDDSTGAGTGYVSRHRQDLLWSDDPNFRPVDMEFAPDGSLYVVDWHNVLIGHMQHNARDPLRDHVHGRIYRVTCPSRPLVEPARVAGADIRTLLDNLKLPEYRTRYRSRRELRGRPADEVAAAVREWVADLDASSVSSATSREHQLLEALWVTWGANAVDESLLRRLLAADDHRVRAAAVRVLRYVGHQVDDQAELLRAAAADEHGRVRMEAMVAATWLDREDGLAVVKEATAHPLDRWLMPVQATAQAHLNGVALGDGALADAAAATGAAAIDAAAIADLESRLSGRALLLYERGREIYERDGYCGTCHQSAGRGLPAAGFPPLAGSEWVTGDEVRLIKVVLKGLIGPIEVDGETYPGAVPMTPFEGLLDDEELAAVLTYVRNGFGNAASAITPEQVAAVRAETGEKSGFYTAEEL